VRKLTVPAVIQDESSNLLVPAVRKLMGATTMQGKSFSLSVPVEACPVHSTGPCLAYDFGANTGEACPCCHEAHLKDGTSVCSFPVRCRTSQSSRDLLLNTAMGELEMDLRC